MITLGIISAVLGATSIGLTAGGMVNNKRLAEEASSLAEIQRQDQLKMAEDNRKIQKEGLRQSNEANVFNRDVAEQDIDLLNRKEKQMESDTDNSIFESSSSLFKTGGLKQFSQNKNKTSLFETVGKLNRGRV